VIPLGDPPNGIAVGLRLVMEKIDIWRAAKVLIDAHGEDAAEAANRAVNRAVEDGNEAATSVWIRVMKAIEILQRQYRNPGGSLN